MSTHSIG